jgi:hypothetical protein
MTGQLRDGHRGIGSDHWGVKPADWLKAAAPARIHQIDQRITHHSGASYPHSVSASEILIGMATRRKPKNPGGRPAVWGPRHTMSIRPPEGLYSKLEDAAEAAGLTVAEYCVVELAASHDFELPNTNSDQLPLAIGA